MVRELLRERSLATADLDVLAFAAGPGSFTGLRIATGVVQGLAWGLQIPVVTVSALQAVALDIAERQQATEGDGLAVAFDARMDEVYWGCFRMENGFPIAQQDERVCSPEAISLPENSGRWLAGGSGWRYADRMPADVVDRMQSPDLACTPDARFVARIAAHSRDRGAGVPAAEAQPVYLRDEVTWKKLPGR